MRINDAAAIGGGCGEGPEDDALLDGWVFTGYIVRRLFVAAMSRRLVPSAERAALPASEEFVRIKSAEAESIDRVCRAPGIRERKVCGLRAEVPCGAPEARR
jgi:hypothetical protein